MGTIQSTKIGAGFKTAGERPGCRDCKHGQQEYTDRMPPYDKAGWKCKVNDHAGGPRIETTPRHLICATSAEVTGACSRQ